MPETLYILDAHSLIFQVFHAIPEMTSPSGQPTNAAFGFTRDILNLLHQRRPTYLVAAFDLPGPTVRHQLFEAYKAHRAPMPAELESQLPLIIDLLTAFGIPILSLEGYEADDVAATVATQAAAEGIDAYIVTNDKDARQLIGPHVRLFNIRKNQVLDEPALRQDWGIRPDQVVDLQALVGDPVDNVPGVPGIGIKTAQKLIHDYGSLEGVIQHIDEIPGDKRRQNLRTHADQARLSRTLVKLECNLPLDLDWDACRTDGGDTNRLLDLFEQLGFNRFAQELLEEQPGGRTWQATYRSVATPADFDAFFSQLAQQPRFSVDLETTSLDALQADIVGFAFAWKTGEAWYVPVRAPKDQPQLDPALVLARLKPILESERVAKVGQNLKYDALVLRAAGVELRGIALDTMLADYLLDAGQRNHNLAQLSIRHLDHRMIPITDLIGNGRAQKRMDEVPLAQITEYAAEDADVAWRLSDILEKRLKDEHLWELFDKLERPLLDVLIQMEFNGIKLDVAVLTRLSAEYGRRLRQIELEIYSQAGRQFNIGSPKQLQQVLFDDLKLAPSRRTKTGASTDQSVLEQLSADHPLPRLLMEHRKLAKLKSTYLDALPATINPRTGRVHASFNQVVAATGRLSSSDPNLQNIPVRTEEGRQIRQAFIPGDPDWLLLTADYSQIELRILAHFSRDPALLTAFEQDADIHTAVAAQIYGVPAEEVTRDMRRGAKTVNFGVIYGLSPFGLSGRLAISQEEAQQFIEAYFRRYAGVQEFIAKVLAEAGQNGYVNTILGRRRRISGVRPAAGLQRNLPERTAINTVIQGSAADLIKQAMIRIHRRLLDERAAARMLLQIHDELVFEVRRDHLDRVAQAVADEMTAALNLDVPMKVDLAAGPNWLDVEPLGLLELCAGVAR